MPLSDPGQARQQLSTCRTCASFESLDFHAPRVLKTGSRDSILGRTREPGATEHRIMAEEAVIVVGGGIVGISCALSAQERGLTVLLCDPGEARRRASYGNAGCISRSSLFPMSGPGLWKNLPNYLLNRDPGLRLHYAKLPRIAPWIAGFMRAANMNALRRAATALDRLTSRAFDAHMHLATRAGASALIKREGMLRLYRTEAAFHAAGHEREILL